jgi:hypothetical protein
VKPANSKFFESAKPYAHSLGESTIIKLKIMLYDGGREAPNARHHPPRTRRIRHGVLRMRVMLFAVGCMRL